MLRHLRIAARTLLRRPSFAAIAVVTLALGIGATTAIFTVVNAVVLEPLPYADSDRLVRLEHPVPLLNPEWKWGMSEAGFFAARESNRSFTDIAVYEASSLVLAGEDVAEEVPATGVSANLFDVLGGRAAVGRLFRWEDNDPEASLAVVLSHEFWRTRLGADPRIVGTTLELNGVAAEVVGVVEPGLDVPERNTHLWYPVRISASKTPVNWHRFNAVARLAPGVTPEMAEGDVRRVMADWPETLTNAYGSDFYERTGFTAAVVPLRDHVVGDIGAALWVLLGAVGIVLLIGCVNVANLFLVRLEAGRRESALRMALGASRADLAAKWLAESVLLGGAAGALGLILAGWGIAALVAAGPDIPRLEEISPGWRSAAFTAAVSLGAALAFGLLPVVRSGVRFEWLREGPGLTASRQRNAARRGLVVFEMALALVLLTGAGLMLRTFHNLRSVDPGLDPEGVLTMELSLPSAHYFGYEAVASFHRSLSERVAALPGVVAVGATQALPLAAPTGCSILFTADAAARQRMSECFASTIQATPGYFRAMGIEVEGEAPSWRDVEARRGGVVVTRAFADHVWPGQSAIGQTVRGNGMGEPYYRIVGVTEDIRANGLNDAPVPQVFFPMLPLEGAPLWSPPRAMALAVRVAGVAPATLAAPIRALIRETDAGIAVGTVRPMTEVVAASMRRTSFAMLLLGIAAAVALALGVIGLYGVIATIVEQRRPEIGIRMALGAGRGEVQRMVVGEAAALAGVGVLVGGAASLVTSGVLAAQLYGVAPRDPVTLGAVAVVLVGVALAAAYIPARRAARVEPMGVLRGG
ncbi:MAG TPA: ABC transporter permease [Longimicrobiales bacterium]|nr:ABC transporter permease [Longimicrobiales bacterium]